MGCRKGMHTPLLWLSLFIAIFVLSTCDSSTETTRSDHTPAVTAAADDRGETADTPSSAENGFSAENGAAAMGKKTIRLGSSLYAIQIAREFSPLNISNEDWEDDMVARYHHERTLLDFSVYQFSKEGYADTLEAFTREEAEEYEASEIVTDVNINGIAAAYYRAVDEYGGVYRDGLTLVLENGDEYLEIDFWFIGYQAENEAWEIIASLTKIGNRPLPLGAYQIWIPEDFTAVSDETANPAVYENGSASLRLYVGHFPAAGKTLSEFVRGRGGSDIETDRELNGIPAAFYRSIEALDGSYHSVWTCVLAEAAPNAAGGASSASKGNGGVPGGFLTLSFRLDGVTAEAEAETILDTLDTFSES